MMGLAWDGSTETISQYQKIIFSGAKGDTVGKHIYLPDSTYHEHNITVHKLHTTVKLL